MHLIENLLKKQLGKTLYYWDAASDELKDDKELVMEAVTNDGGALEFASDRLKADREILMKAVEKKKGLGFMLCK